MLPPNAAEDDALIHQVAQSRPALFLDYDGTITEIRPRPELAVLSEDMRRCLARLSSRIPLAVISGRDLDDVRDRVAVPAVLCVGNHGLDMPGGRQVVGDDLLARLAEARRALQSRLPSWPGAWLEIKRYGVTMHTRGASVPVRQSVSATVAALAAVHPGLREVRGKDVHELRPDCDWDKGKAVAAILRQPDCAGRLPVYLGDDITDEDAFRALGDRGLPILVGDHGSPTLAKARLPGVEDVRRFLHRLATHLDAAAGG